MDNSDVNQPVTRTFYRPQWSRIEPNGTIAIRVSWWDDGEDGTVQSVGWMEILPEHADYNFWKWILSQPERFNRSINDETLAILRQEYADPPIFEPI